MNVHCLKVFLVLCGYDNIIYMHAVCMCVFVCVLQSKRYNSVQDSVGSPCGSV